MNGHLAREYAGARRPKGRWEACPTTFSKHVLNLLPPVGALQNKKDRVWISSVPDGTLRSASHQSR